MRFLLYTLLGLLLTFQALILYYKTIWLIIPISLLWSLLIITSFNIAKQKRASAIFVINDRHAKLKYLILLILTSSIVALLCFYSTNESSSVVMLFNGINMWFLVLMNILRSTYYLFDNTGVTRSEGVLKYNDITKMRVTDTTVAFDTPTAINELVIKKNLVTEELLKFLNSQNIGDRE